MDQKHIADRVMDVFARVAEDLRAAPDTPVVITFKDFEPLRFCYARDQVPEFMQQVQHDAPDLWFGGYMAATFLTLLNVHPEHTDEVLFHIMTGSSHSTSTFMQLGKAVRTQDWDSDEARDDVRDRLLIEAATYELKSRTGVYLG